MTKDEAQEAISKLKADCNFNQHGSWWETGGVLFGLENAFWLWKRDRGLLWWQDEHDEQLSFGDELARRLRA